MRFKNQEEFNTCLSEALAGNRLDQARLKEAIASDQLAPMFMSAANVRFEDVYKNTETLWDKIAQKELLNDFRPAAFMSLESDISSMPVDNGGFKAIEGTLSHIPELTPYPTMKYTANGRFIETGKHGARVQFSFEAFVNDEWNIIERFPADAGELAARTEDLLVLLQLFNPATKTLRTDVFDTGNDTLLDLSKVPDEIKGEATGTAGAVPLSLGAIAAARYQALNTTRNGRYVTVPNGFVLLAAPGLAEVAKDYTRITEVRRTVGKETYITANPIKDIEVVSSDLVGLVGGSKAWVLLPKGGKTSAKTTLVKTGLRGHENPELRVHNATGVLLGGGAVDYREGSFDNDDAEIRIRQIAGAGIVNYDGIVGSNGA